MEIKPLVKRDLANIAPGDKALTKKLENELELAEKTGCVIYVRHGKTWVQWLHVDRKHLSDDVVLKQLKDESLWEHVRLQAKAGS